MKREDAHALSVACLAVVFLQSAAAQLAAAQLADSTKGPAPKSDSTFFRVSAEGSVRSAVQGQSGNPEAGTGALGLTIERTSGLLFNARITIPSGRDTLSEGFGASVLTPSTTEGISAHVSADVPVWSRKSGLRASGVVARRTWSDTASQRAASAIVLGAGLQFYHHVENRRFANNHFRLTVLAGPTLRLIAGDAATDDMLRRSVLGSTSVAFLGGQVGLELAIGGVTGSFDFFIVPAAKVAGLTSGQVSAGFSLNAELWEFHSP